MTDALKVLYNSGIVDSLDEVIPLAQLFLNLHNEEGQSEEAKEAYAKAAFITGHVIDKIRNKITHND